MIPFIVSHNISGIAQPVAFSNCFSFKQIFKLLPGNMEDCDPDHLYKHGACVVRESYAIMEFIY